MQSKNETAITQFSKIHGIKEEVTTAKLLAKLQVKMDLAYNAIKQTLSINVRETLRRIPRGEARAVWHALIAQYQRITPARKKALRKQLYNTEMESDVNSATGFESISTYLNRVDTICIELEGMNVRLSDKDKRGAILCGLPECYDNTVETIEDRDESYYDAMVRLRDREQMLTIPSEGKAQENVFLANTSNTSNRSTKKTIPNQGTKEED